MKVYIYHIKYLTGVAICLLGCRYAEAQQRKLELSVTSGSTVSWISQELKVGETKNKNGVLFGLRSSLYLNDNWSLGLEVEYQSYRSDVRLNNVRDSYNTTDFDQEPFEFRYTANSYNEVQRIENINVPVTLQYETDGRKVRFYALTGVKAGFVINGTTQTRIGSLVTSGYYPQYNAELFNPKFMGFGTFNNVKSAQKDLDAKMAWSATFESGIKCFLNKKNAVYFGLFFDVGMNYIVDNEPTAKQLIVYPSDEYPVDLQYNSLSNTPYAEKMRLSSFGLKMRYSFFND
ncbi:PorT family protein [Zhouia spongiae]|uniref:PorT family protein n=1 Tax=Zhouia spongiae TaxID=2202721 RepID=A0ABY3YLX4_9FLAO|nr:outer membrane beta-barrel protein [Zhouia spongiae]UNY98835.1 PorT family protein [Zhouia spongiae]